jgi:RNA polymerase sigma factor (sigma-70 family)
MNYWDECDNPELEIIKKAKSGNEEAINHLIDSHSGICVNVYKKYLSPGIAPQYVQDDIVNSKNYIIYNSIKSYDPSHGSKFSTWLANQVRFYCLNCINKNKKHKFSEVENIENLSENEEPKWNPYDESLKKDRIDQLKELVDSIDDKKIKTLIQKKYFSEKNKVVSFTEIAKEMGVTVQTAINWHNKFINFAKTKIKN